VRSGVPNRGRSLPQITIVNIWFGYGGQNQIDDRVVSPDARFHELEAIGYPRGPEGFKVFRRQINAAIPDEHISIIAVRFEGADIIEADLDISATHTGGEIMGIPAATGRKIRFEVRSRARFVDGKMAERWDQVDFEHIKRQLTGPTQ